MGRKGEWWVVKGVTREVGGHRVATPSEGYFSTSSRRNPKDDSVVQLLNGVEEPVMLTGNEEKTTRPRIVRSDSDVVDQVN